MPGGPARGLRRADRQGAADPGRDGSAGHAPAPATPATPVEGGAGRPDSAAGEGSLLRALVGRVTDHSAFFWPDSCCVNYVPPFTKEMVMLTNKVALITGGTSGIGKAAALAMAKAGAQVVLAGRRTAEGQAVANEIHSAGGQARFVKADVAQEADVKNLIEATLQHFGRLDIAYNNAGVDHVEPLTELTTDAYRRIFDVNVLGVLLSMKYEVPSMLKAGGGSIINTSSVLGHV